MALDPAAPAQPEEPRPVVPEAVVRPDRPVPRDQGLRHHDVLLHQHRRHGQPEDDARLLRRCCPSTCSKGRTNLLDGAEEVVPLALMALGLDPNTDSSSDFAKVKKFLLEIRQGVTTIDSSGYINDAIAGKIILGQGWNGDVRRIVQARKKQGDITAVIPTEASEMWADNWCIPVNAPAPGGRARVDQLAAHAVDGGGRDELPQLPDPDPGGARADAGGAEERPAVQRAEEVHGQLPVHPQREPGGGERSARRSTRSSRRPDGGRRPRTGG